jgi:ubiquinone/menaquinone biosynthesis C-methylase UbiE
MHQHGHAHAHDEHTTWSSFELAGFLAGLTELPRTVLDVGCGAGGDAVYLAGRGMDVIGVDLSAESLEQARAHADRGGVDVTWIQASALDLPVEDASIDLVTDRGCLHHIEPIDHARYAQEVARVLRPGGMLLVRDMQHAGNDGPQVTEPGLGGMIDGLPLQLSRVVPFQQGRMSGILAVFRR